MFSRVTYLCFLAALMTLNPPVRAKEMDRLPDRNSILTQLQKIGGKEWNVTTTTDGYLMTYTHPVVFCPAVSSSSKIDANQRLLSGRRDSLRIKIVFGPPLTPNELHWTNSPGEKLAARYAGLTPEEFMWLQANVPYLEMDAIPSQAALQKEFNDNHYYLIEPRTWARGPKYTAYFLLNEAPGELVHPREAEGATSRIVEGLDSLFKLQLFIED